MKKSGHPRILDRRCSCPFLSGVITWGYYNLELLASAQAQIWISVELLCKKNTKVAVMNGSCIKLLSPSTRGPWYLPPLPFCGHIFAYARLLLNLQDLIKVLSLPLHFTEISWSPVNQYKIITITNHNTLHVGYNAKHGDPQKYEQSLWLGRGQGYKQLRGLEGTHPNRWMTQKGGGGQRRHIPRTKTAVRSLHRKNES